MHDLSTHTYCILLLPKYYLCGYEQQSGSYNFSECFKTESRYVSFEMRPIYPEAEFVNL